MGCGRGWEEGCRLFGRAGKGEGGGHKGPETAGVSVSKSNFYGLKGESSQALKWYTMEDLGDQ